jgi:hypothetical protein
MSCVFQYIDPPSPTPPGSVPLLRGEGTHSPGGEGVGGQYFGRRKKTQLCTLPISNPLCFQVSPPRWPAPSSSLSSSVEYRSSSNKFGNPCSGSRWIRNQLTSWIRILNFELRIWSLTVFPKIARHFKEKSSILSIKKVKKRFKRFTT